MRSYIGIFVAVALGFVAAGALAQLGGGGFSGPGTVSQRCFLALNSAQDANQTGNGATATIDFDTEIFDQGANFAADTFTAPVTGRYLLSATVRFSGTTAAADSITLNLATSNRTYARTFGTTNDTLMFTTVSISAVADMDASDTVTVTMVVAGESSDVVDIDGNAAPQTFFSGCLLARG